MPKLGYEEFSYGSDTPDYGLVPDWKHSFFDLHFDVLPFRGKEVSGVVKCEARVIDAFRSYSVCRLEDEKGDVVFTSGWVVDLDPEKDYKVKSLTDTLVTYFISSRKDFLKSSDLSVEVKDVKERLERVERGKYSVVVGYVHPPEEFYTEMKEKPKEKWQKELIEEYEEALREEGFL